MDRLPFAIVFEDQHARPLRKIRVVFQYHGAGLPLDDVRDRYACDSGRSFPRALPHTAAQKRRAAASAALTPFIPLVSTGSQISTEERGPDGGFTLGYSAGRSSGSIEARWVVYHDGQEERSMTVVWISETYHVRSR
jgi:hypothetical protein